MLEEIIVLTYYLYSYTVKICNILSEQLKYQQYNTVFENVDN